MTQTADLSRSARDLLRRVSEHGANGTCYLVRNRRGHSVLVVPEPGSHLALVRSRVYSASVVEEILRSGLVENGSTWEDIEFFHRDGRDGRLGFFIRAREPYVPTGTDEVITRVLIPGHSRSAIEVPGLLARASVLDAAYLGQQPALRRFEADLDALGWVLDRESEVLSPKDPQWSTNTTTALVLVEDWLDSAERWERETQQAA